MRKKYILLKETPELKKGAIVTEDCDGGDQGFSSAHEYFKFDDQEECSYTRKVVMGNPEWFQEVDVCYFTKEQIRKIKRVLGFDKVE